MPAALGRVVEALGAVAVECDRLLADHVLAGRQGSGGERDVQVVGRADVDDVHVGRRDQLLGGLERPVRPQGLGRALCAPGRGGGDPDEARSREPGGPCVDGTDEPGPSYGNA